MDTDPSGSGPQNSRKEMPMSDFAWFGYPALENSILAWGARAIFHSSAESPLDILWDRQGHKYDRDTQKETHRQFVGFINQTVLPKLQELATISPPATTASSCGISSGPTIRAWSSWLWGARTAPTATSISRSIWCPRKVLPKWCDPRHIGRRCQQNRRVEATEAAAEAPVSWQVKIGGHRRNDDE